MWYLIWLIGVGFAIWLTIFTAIRCDKNDGQITTGKDSTKH